MHSDWHESCSRWLIWLEPAISASETLLCIPNMGVLYQCEQYINTNVTQWPVGGALSLLMRALWRLQGQYGSETECRKAGKCVIIVNGLWSFYTATRIDWNNILFHSNHAVAWKIINNIVILDNNIGALTKLLVFLFITALLMHFTTFFCSCLSITYHVFLPSCMQPAGSYAKVTNMINKIIAGFLGDDQEEVTLLQWWRVVL